jgi:MFS family permease
MLAHLRNRQLLATYSVGFCVLFSLVAVFTLRHVLPGRSSVQLGSGGVGVDLLRVLDRSAGEPQRGACDRSLRAARGPGLRDRCGIVGVALTLVHNLWVVGLGLTICSTGVFAATTAANTFVGVAAKENRALAVGLYATFYYIGGSLGAAIPGYFWDWGGWPACVAFVAFVQAVTVILALAFWKRSPVVVESPAMAP